MELTAMEKTYTPENVNPELTEMTVYRALSMRKIYAAQLEKMGLLKEKDLDTSGFVVVKKQSEMKDTEEMDRLTKNLQAKYDKTISLFRNFYALNSAIQQSNAVTKVTVGGKTYTMAEAISRYDRINAEINFFNGIAVNVATAVGNMEESNKQALKPEVVEKYINNAMDALPEGSITGEEEISKMREKLKEKYTQENTSVLIDPYNLRDKIEDILNEKKAFASEFNEMMNATNLTTKIWVNLIND